MSVYGDRSFKLTDQFLSQYKGKQPDWGYGALGYVTYKRTYARQLEDGSTEEFWQTCQRVVEGVMNIQKAHCERLNTPWDNYKAHKTAKEMYRRMWEFKWLPPGRGLWMMGAEHVSKVGAAGLNNCGFVSTEHIDKDFSDPFCWLMDMSMLGVGVGFDVKGAGKVEIKRPKHIPVNKEVIEDTREGWVKSVKLLLEGFKEGTYIPDFDYSQIRPAGEPIKGFGGVASGPQPLIELHENLCQILDARVGSTITTSDIVDICNLIGKCVVAGNVRRTAEIAFGPPDSDEYLSLKDPELHQETLMSHRWASNNSIFAERGMDYTKVAEQTAKNGEPGYMWLQNAQQYGRMKDGKNNKDARARGGNPCLEQTLEDHELCCLVETFPAHHDSVEDYYDTLKFAYLYAKTVTLVPTHEPRTNAVLLRNRRIGLSQSGIVQAMEKFGTRTYLENVCDKGYVVVKEWDRIYSEWFCIPESIKVTSVKPSGTVSLLAGATPGIHYPHSQYYIRRVRIAANSSLLEPLKKAGYRMEQDAYGTGSIVVEFPVKEEHCTRAKTDVSMWEQLELAAQLQHYWADNQVSVTVTFPHKYYFDGPDGLTMHEDYEATGAEIAKALELYETRLKGVSFLPLQDHSYVQAPYETITEDEYEASNSRYQGNR